jgi:hypothetical protein
MADNEDEFLDEETIAKRRRRENRPDRKLVIKQSDLPRTLQTDIIECAQCALDDEQSGVQKNLAMYIKQKLDREQGGTWHVIVGNHFGGNVTSDAATLINFQLDNKYFLLFRSGPPEKPKAKKADEVKSPK